MTSKKISKRPRRKRRIQIWPPSDKQSVLSRPPL